MWEFIEAKADAITALIAVLGFVLAAILGFVSVRTSSQALRAQASEHLDGVLGNFLQAVTKFQHMSLLPYWKTGKVDPESEAALKVHESITELTTQAKVLGRTTLSDLEPQIENVAAAANALYQSALYGCEQEDINYSLRPEKGRVQLPEAAWTVVEQSLARHSAGMGFIQSSKTTALDVYTGEAGVIQMADVALNVANDELIAAYKKLQPAKVYVRSRV